jgi:hypothetical protein
MSITLKLPGVQQHERLFLDDVIRRYKLKLISAADYILSLTNIYRPKGQKLNLPTARSFYEQFGIPKSTFYRSLKRLENLPELGFRWEPTGGISIWCEETKNATIPLVSEKEPTYTQLKQLPSALRNEFEIFVKSEWRKIKGEEIRSFHRFVEKLADFQNWWAKFQKFQQHKTTAARPAAGPAAGPELEPNKRTFSSIPENLKGLFGKKPT